MAMRYVADVYYAKQAPCQIQSQYHLRQRSYKGTRHRIPQSLDIWQSQLASRDSLLASRDSLLASRDSLLASRDLQPRHAFRQSEMSDRIFFPDRISGPTTCIS